MKRLLRPAALAFSCYSRIPMPSVEYDERDKRRVFCFFPLVGIVSGAAVMLWIYIAGRLSLNHMLCAAGFTAVPVLLTGGIHLDGFMDTSDAMASHRSPEEQLAIMKDPHIGSFAVIAAVLWFMTFFSAAYSAAEPGAVIASLAAAPVFCEARAFTSAAVVRLPRAKKEGMLSWYVRENRRQDAVVVTLTSAIYIAGCTALQFYLAGPYSLVIPGAGLICSAVCCIFFRKRYGGITGDLAGFHLCCCELAMIIAAAVLAR